jgi:hypothetical protein
MDELYTEIEMRAAPGMVWQILTDFGRVADWNPSMLEITGVPVTGERLEVQFRNEDGTAGMRFRPKVLKAEPNRELRWLGHLFGIPGLFDGEHRFVIESLDHELLRFIQAERFGGILVPFLAKRLDTETRRSFEAMNRALKAEVERLG